MVILFIPLFSFLDAARVLQKFLIVFLVRQTSQVKLQWTKRLDKTFIYRPYQPIALWPFSSSLKKKECQSFFLIAVPPFFCHRRRTRQHLDAIIETVRNTIRTLNESKIHFISFYSNDKSRKNGRRELKNFVVPSLKDDVSRQDVRRNAVKSFFTQS